MTRIYFVVPVHGREALTRVCLRQLRRTCDALAPAIDATAVVVGNDASLDFAYNELDFATVERDNSQLGRKFNDGYEFACDERYNPEPADFCVACGSDDWIDPVIFRRLPPTDRIGIFRQIGVVSEDRTLLSRLRVAYEGGAGIRIYPRQLLALAGYRPAEEHQRRAIDTSTLYGITNALHGRKPAMVELDVHELQIIDWKSSANQLNPYQSLRSHRRGAETGDPFAQLAEHYPAEAIDEMRALAEELVAA